LITRAAILETLFDKETLKIVGAIASSDSKSDILITRLGLTRKQYYSRIFSLIRAGLVKRDKGRYYLTAFGKVIHNAEVSLENRIEDALKSYWALKAIDSMQMSYGREGEWENIVSLLIHNEGIKNALTGAGVPKIIAQSEFKKTRNVDQNIVMPLPNAT
jgi:hypothetical protein